MTVLDKTGIFKQGRVFTGNYNLLQFRKNLLTILRFICTVITEKQTNEF